VNNSTASRDALLVLLLETETLKCLGNQAKTHQIQDSQIILKLQFLVHTFSTHLSSSFLTSFSPTFFLLLSFIPLLHILVWLSSTKPPCNKWRSPTFLNSVLLSVCSQWQILFIFMKMYLDSNLHLLWNS